MIRAILLSLCLTKPASAQEYFVENNVLAIFYHEFGHALIDILGLPVFGQEEDAADVVSVILIDQLFEDAGATEIAMDSAALFAAEADETPDFPYWDVHGPDAQRFYNIVCLFAGAQMETRADFAQDMGLPEERQDGCEEEFELANDSWGPVLDEIAGQGDSLRFTPHPSPMGLMMQEEIAALNGVFRLPDPLDIRIEDCGEGNAFYDPNDRSITLCTELPGYIASFAN